MGANAGCCGTGVSCGAWLGVSGTGVGTGEEMIASEMSLEVSGRAFDGGETGGSGSSGVEGFGDGATGAGSTFPVPAGSSGVVVTMISRVDVKVLAGSRSLFRISCSEDDGWEDDVSCPPPNTKDMKSGNWRDSSFSEDELEDEDAEDDAGTAGAVTLVSICRFMCRGK